MRAVKWGLNWGFRLWGALLLGSCDGGSAAPQEEEGSEPPIPTVEELRQVIPGEGLPKEVISQDANNNLDLTFWEGRYWLAFRTAPSHFASADAWLYVISSEDEMEWRFEGSFNRGTDLREPRLLAWEGQLFLYFAVLGDSVVEFEPQGMMVTQRVGMGEWTEPEWFYGEGFIPWRVRVVDGIPYLMTYVGGENIYDLDGEPIEVHWLTTTDGWEWTAVIPGQPVVQTGGGSETDFAFLEDGSLVAVTRNEAGDETGWGSKICRAEADSLGDWECLGDPRKYDSPLVFRHGSHVYLVGRRNLTETGNYDLQMDDLEPEDQTLQYEFDYWQQPKRCSLWHVEPESQTVEFLLDLPSQGDTCFAAVVPLSETRYLLYNYSSPVDGEDPSWIEGQTDPTHIYRMVLAFSE